MERVPRASAGAPRQACHRRTQYPPIETQPSVQPGDPVYKAASREDRLRASAKARGLAPCAPRFAEHGLAQYFVSWICRLHADLGIRRGDTEANQVGPTKTER